MSGEGAPPPAAEAERMVEALLFAAAEPLSTTDLAARLPAHVDVGGRARRPAGALRRTRGGAVAGRGRPLALRHRRRPGLPDGRSRGWRLRRLSRAAYEVLAIVAYHQPVTRAEVEDVRGVALSRGTLDILLEVGWVRMRGRRRSPGRPVTYATTDAFLIHFGLASLADLPGASDMRAAGLLSLDLPPGFAVPDPSRATDADEDPLEGEPPEFVRDYVEEG